MLFNDSEIDLSKPHVMGILNVTPDSFSDGGKFVRTDDAVRQVESMLNDGATFIDVGGESTRPGAADVSLQDELDRVIPVIELIRREFECVVSVDTSKPVVMDEAIKAGVGLINDVRALREPGALEIASSHDAAICLMHMQGQPRTMQTNPTYDDVTRDVITFLSERVSACEQAGIASDKIIIDPGFGFGKTTEHNFALLSQLAELKTSGCPILVGISRKSMIGNLLNRNVDERLAGSLAAATISVLNGASIIRAHDVKETVDAVKIALATMKN